MAFTTRESRACYKHTRFCGGKISPCKVYQIFESAIRKFGEKLHLGLSETKNVIKALLRHVYFYYSSYRLIAGFRNETRCVIRRYMEGQCPLMFLHPRSHMETVLAVASTRHAACASWQQVKWRGFLKTVITACCDRGNSCCQFMMWSIFFFFPLFFSP